MTDLPELFARDPLSHTDEDIAKIIEAYRASRHEFVNNGNKTAGRAPRAPKLDPEIAALDVKISL